MRIDEVERQIANQHSMMQAFPSQTPTIEKSFSGENQRALIAMQIQSVKLSTSHDKKLEKTNEVLTSLLEWAHQQQIASQQREVTEVQRYRENTRLSRIAAWSGVIALILSAIGVIAQIALK